MTTQSIKDMAKRLYAHDEFGAMHIVVSDGNVDDGNICACLDRPAEPLTDADKALATDLLAMDEDDRFAAWELAFTAPIS